MDKQKHVLFEEFGLKVGLIALASLALGAVFQGILNVGDFWRGMFAASLLTFLCGVAMVLVWRAAGAQRVLAWMMLVAFFLRLALGVFLAWGLPQFGYDTAPQQAGFVYNDPYLREGNAWMLAQSDKSLLDGFGDTYLGDQYGGMFTMSAFIYRYISPDAFRPVLITILAAGASSLSLPFLVAALRRKFDSKIALLAGWVMALYPESILLGASQMREPFYILWITMLIWYVSLWMQRKNAELAYLAAALSTIGLLTFSYRMAIPVFSFFLLWLWFEWTADKEQRSWHIVRWVVLAIGSILVLISMRDWLVDAAQWDTFQVYRFSGRIQFHLAALSDWLHSPLIWSYGILQPVLPAAVAHPAPWIWRGLGIMRAIGWYAMLPLLVYALFRVWKLPASPQKRFLVLSTIFIWIWIIIASVRAGGGQWDNPRYRTIFLPLMAAVWAWGVHFARQYQDRWLTRGLVIEGIFLGFFTQWYISRYYQSLPRLQLEVMILVIILLSAGVIISGWLWDRKHPRNAPLIE